MKRVVLPACVTLDGSPQSQCLRNSSPPGPTAASALASPTWTPIPIILEAAGTEAALFMTRAALSPVSSRASNALRPGKNAGRQGRGPGLISLVKSSEAAAASPEVAGISGLRAAASHSLPRPRSLREP